MVNKPGISFFCPAYYDEKNISGVVEKAVKVFSEICRDYEIYIIEDGSPDRTGEVADELSRKYEKVHAIHHPKNLGYAQALKTGFANARKFEYVVYTDGDNQYDVEDVKRMLPLLKDNNVVITYRTKNANNLIRKIISISFNFILRLLFKVPFKDMSSSLKIFERAVIDKINITSKSPFANIEIVIMTHKLGYKIAQIDINTSPRCHGRSTSLIPKNFFMTILEMIKFKINSK